MELLRREVILLILAIVVERGHTFKITPLASGVVFAKEASVVATNFHWSIVAEFDFQELRNHSAQLEGIFEVLEKAFKNKPCYDDEITRTMADSLRVLYQALNQEFQDLIDLLPRGGNRAKRALFSLGGKLLKQAFGTLTESDLAHLQSRLDTLEQSNDNVQISLSKQLILTTNLESSITNNTKAIRKLADVFIAKTTELQDTMNRNLREIETLFVQQLYSTQVLQQLVLAITNTRTELTRLRIALMQATAGKLSDVLINPKTYLQYLQLIQKQLGTEWHMLFPCTLENVHRYYQIATVNIALMGQKLRILIDVPIGSVDAVLDRYDIHTFPVLWEETSHYVQWKMHDVLLINKNQQSYTVLNVDELGRCKNSIITICPLLTLHDRSKACCETSMFFNEDFSDQCQREIMALQHPYLATLHSNWIFAMPKPSSITVTCWDDQMEPHVNKIELRGAGVIENATQCQFIGENFIIPPMRRSSMSQSLDFPQYHLPKFNRSIYHSQKLIELNRTNPHILNHEITKHLKQAQDSIKYNHILAAMETQIHTQSKHKTTVTTISLTGILGAATIIVLILYLYKRHARHVAQLNAEAAVPTAAQIIVDVSGPSQVPQPPTAATLHTQ